MQCTAQNDPRGSEFLVQQLWHDWTTCFCGQRLLDFPSGVIALKRNKPFPKWTSYSWSLYSAAQGVSTLPDSDSLGDSL
jgi:hypothetical protein